jgi:hypothetical protein
MTQEGLFYPRFDLVELFMDGASRGVYTLMENPTAVLRQRFSGLTSVLRRTFSRAIEAPEVKWAVATEDQAVGSYRALVPSLGGLSGAPLESALQSRMNLDQYLAWIALMNLLGSGDYIDESYFIATETTGQDQRPADYFTFMGWDQDDAFAPCHYNGRFALPDPNGLLGCAESELDRRILSDPTIYQRYVAVLAAMAQRLTRQRFEGALNVTMTKLLSFLQNPATLAAMTELARIHPVLNRDYGVLRAEMQREVASLVSRFEMHRDGILSRIAAYQRGR